MKKKFYLFEKYKNEKFVFELCYFEFWQKGLKKKNNRV